MIYENYAKRCFQSDAMDFDDKTSWTQQVTISRRKNNDLETVDTSNTSDVKYVTANILYNEQSILEASWLVTSEVAQ